MTDDADKNETGSLLQVNITDVFGFGKAAEKLSPTAARVVEGLGKFLDPPLSAAKIYLETRASGAANRHETKKNLEQISEVDKILATDHHLAQAMKARLISTEMRRQANIHAAAEQAVEIANTLDQSRLLTPLDQDFVQEWMEGVKDVSTEEVRTIWASLLAHSPKSPDGRISKPALELLKQFDQPTAKCFWEYVKTCETVGYPSIKAPSNWAPFGTPLRLKLLEELGVIEQMVCRAVSLPRLGSVNQFDPKGRSFQLVNTLNIWVFRQRGMELVNSLFVEPASVDAELVEKARLQNLSWFSDDAYWMLAVRLERDAETDVFRISTTTEKGVTFDVASELLSSLPLDEVWRRVFLNFARDERVVPI